MASSNQSSSSFPAQKSSHNRSISLPDERESDDHVDSPVRKKPRLDSEMSASPPATPPSPGSPSQIPTAKPTPSKVTLNLRNPRPLSPQSVASSNDEHDELADVDPSQDILIDSIVSKSPEPVDIAIDDSDEGGQDDPHDHDAMLTSSSSQTLDAKVCQFMSEFPGANGDPDRAGMIMQRQLDSIQNAGVFRFDDGLLEDVGEWLKDWLQMTRELPDRWKLLYSSRFGDFWSHLTSWLSKLLLKNWRFASVSAQRVRSTLEGAIPNHLEICAQISAMDSLHISERHADDKPLNQQDLYIGTRAMRFWETVTKQQLGLLDSLEQHFRIHTKQSIESLIKVILSSYQRRISPFIQALTTISSVHHACKGVDKAYAHGLKGLSQLTLTLSEIELAVEGNNTTVPCYSELANGIIGISAALSQAWAIKVDKSQFSGADYAHHLHHLSLAMKYAASFDANAIIEHWGRKFHDVQTRPDLDIIAEMVVQDFCQTIFWTFLTKGRMELRIWATETWSKHLADLFHFLNRSDAEKECLQAFARYINQVGFIPYIVSVESHPQLITRSSNIVCYVAAAELWNPQITASICEAITSSQDKRMRSAILEMLCSSPSAFLPKLEILRVCHLLCNISNEMLDWDVWQWVYKFLTNVLQRNTEDESVDAGSDLSLAHYKLCIWIMQQSCSPTEAQGRNDPKKFLDAITRTFLHLLQTLSTQTERALLLSLNLNALESTSLSTAGVVVAINSILMQSGPEERSSYCEKFQLPSRIVSSTCAFIEANHMSGDLCSLVLGVDVRLSILGGIVSFDKGLGVDDTLTKRLWDSLVGPSAPEVIRETGWDFYTKIVKTTEAQGPFIETILDQYLAELTPDCFVRCTAEFIWAVVSFQTSNLVANLEGAPPMPLKLPLHDFLYDVMLNCTNEASAIEASCLFGTLYCTSDPITKAPLPNAEATHIEIVQQLVRTLQQAASAFEGASSSDDRHTPVMQFLRSLTALKNFLGNVRMQPQFTNAASKSPSPELNGSSPLVEGVRVFPIEVHESNGTRRPVRHLRISQDATVGDVFTELQGRTHFSKMRIIQGGDQTTSDQNEYLHKLVSERFPWDGLMMVQALGPKLPSSIKPGQAYTARSAAEAALLSSFDSLHAFLDLGCPPICEQICEFLVELPAHPSVLINLSDNYESSADTLLPAAKPHKLRYSLRILREALFRSHSSGQIDAQWALKVIGAVRVACTRKGDETSDLSSPLGKAIWLELVSFLTLILHKTPEIDVSIALGDSHTLVERFCQKLVVQSQSNPESGHRGHHIAVQTYECLLQASLRDRRIWTAFQQLPDSLTIHRSLLLRSNNGDLRRTVKNFIEGVCRSPPSLADAGEEHLAEYAMFYWSVAQDLVQEARMFPQQSGEVFALVNGLLHRMAKALEGKASNWTLLFRTWMDMLLEHEYGIPPGSMDVDYFLHGLSMCLCTWLKLSEKRPFEDSSLASQVFKKFLFPPLPVDGACRAPPVVLHGQTRACLYDLVCLLCGNNVESIEILTRDLQVLADDEDSFPEYIDYGTDKDKYLRASAGFPGLRNLTNTCYMNSLMSQLFMNGDFRNFFTQSLPASMDAIRSHRLIHETNELFTRMQNSQRKFIDTWSFAAAVKPYDADEIDVTLQMDVDEFYSLLFDRWESQLPTDALKQEFRSIFGGKLLNQIKSLDCNHVSERVEVATSIQCEIKGKMTLLESLEAYVQGDVMEGDNKYRCESCDGRLVNAVKRTCLKEVPSNLIFHLKRFDFDLTTLQRAKINDRFEFPAEIDMRPYQLESLGSPKGKGVPDLFDLVGILVHSGTAETGHYYSYIKAEASDATNNRHAWLEFNDAEVSEFDPNKIPDQCFGGELEAQGHSWPKTNSAYMLFYRRRQHSSPTVLAANHKPVTIESAQRNPDPAAAAQHDPQSIEIEKENSFLLRRYCLLSDGHSVFMSRLLELAVGLARDSLTDIEQHNRALKVAVAGQALAICYLDRIASRSRESSDYNRIFNVLFNAISGFPAMIVPLIQAIERDPQILLHLLVENSNADVRRQMANFLESLLKRAREECCDSPEDWPSYGLDLVDVDIVPTTTPEVGCDYNGALPTLLRIMSDLMPEISRNVSGKWTEYLTLIAKFAKFGSEEMDFLLKHGFFLDTLELFIAADGSMADSRRRWEDFSLTDLGPFRFDSRRHEQTHMQMRKAKRQFLDPVTYLLSIFFDSVSAEDVDEYMGEFEMSCLPGGKRLGKDDDTQRWPLLAVEARLLRKSDKHNCNQFTMRLCDTADASSARPTIHRSILRNLIHCFDNDATARISICEAIKINIAEYYPEHQQDILPLASELVLQMHDPDLIREVLEIVAQKLRELERNELERLGDGVPFEMSSKNLRCYIEFWRSLIIEARSNRRANLECLVWKCLPLSWPVALMFEEHGMRREAAQFLHDELFAHEPRPRDENFQISDLDVVRTQGVHTLFRALARSLKLADQRQFTSPIVEQSLIVFDHCYRWLKLFEEPELNEVQAELATVDLAREIHDIMRVVRAYQWSDLEDVTEEEAVSASGLFPVEIVVDTDMDLMTDISLDAAADTDAEPDYESDFHGGV